MTDVYVGSQRRLSMPAELMAQMNDILINTFNVPTLRPLTLQGCK